MFGRLGDWTAAAVSLKSETGKPKPERKKQAMKQAVFCVLATGLIVSAGCSKKRPASQQCKLFDAPYFFHTLF
jgi:hypothetical protein